MTKLLLFGVALLLLGYSEVQSLECYVCENQENNSEKCAKTIKTCEFNQDVCLTEIRWGSMPYWSQGAKKQYYISKRCSNRTDCATTRQHYMPLCTHIWYQDWICSDCCQGDRCNYYVISGGVSFNPTHVLLAATVLLLTRQTFHGFIGL